MPLTHLHEVLNAHVRLSILLTLSIVILSLAIPSLLPFLLANQHNMRFVGVMVANPIETTELQRVLADYADYLQPKTTSSKSAIPDISDSHNLLSSVFRGEYYRLQGMPALAADWYRTASVAQLQSTILGSLSAIPRSRLLPDGNLLVHDFENLDNWQLLPETNVNDVLQESKDDMLSISFANRFDQRDILAYQLYPAGGVPIANHKTLSFRIFLNPGTFFTLDIKVDGGIKRYLAYHQGNGNWEIISTQLDGDRLEGIIMSFGEPGSSNPPVPEYSIKLDWARLELPQR